MRLPLACADFTFPLLPHDKSLDLIAALELDGVDIGLFEERSHLWPSREFERLPFAAHELRAKLEDRGLRAADIFLQLSPDFTACAVNHPDASRRAQARSSFTFAVAYAHIVGSKHLTILPGALFGEESPQDSLARCEEELAWRVAQAQRVGITLGVEAHVGSIVPDPDSALALVEAVPGLTLTLDYTHFTRAGFPDHRVEPLVRHASHFHVRGAREGRLQASFKDNTIDYGRVLQAMRDSGYKGWLGIEYVWIDWERCNEVDNLSETILFRDFLRRQLTGG